MYTVYLLNTVTKRYISVSGALLHRLISMMSSFNEKMDETLFQIQQVNRRLDTLEATTTSLTNPPNSPDRAPICSPIDGKLPIKSLEELMIMESDVNNTVESCMSLVC